MCHGNLGVLSPSENCPQGTQRSVYKARPSAPSYTRDQLFNMSGKLKLSKYCILPFNTIETSRKYKINKHPRKLDLKRNTQQTKVNTKNLVQIKQNKETCNSNSGNICIATKNVRSNKNKVEQIKETSKLENTNFVILTETWLKDTDEDRPWVATSSTDNEEYRIDTVNLHTKRGEG